MAQCSETWFDSCWLEVEQADGCDARGGMEWARVLTEWREAGRPGEPRGSVATFADRLVTMRFIHERANVGA